MAVPYTRAKSRVQSIFEAGRVMILKWVAAHLREGMQNHCFGCACLALDCLKDWGLKFRDSSDFGTMRFQEHSKYNAQQVQSWFWATVCVLFWQTKQTTISWQWGFLILAACPSIGHIVWDIVLYCQVPPTAGKVGDRTQQPFKLNPRVHCSWGLSVSSSVLHSLLHYK